MSRTAVRKCWRRVKFDGSGLRSAGNPLRLANTAATSPGTRPRGIGKWTTGPRDRYNASRVSGVISQDRSSANRDR